MLQFLPFHPIQVIKYHVIFITLFLSLPVLFLTYKPADIMLYLFPLHPTTIICRKIRKKEASKFHIQLSIAMFFMLLFFLVGIRRVEHKISCTVFSLLIHYFTLASVAWMGAEAVLMFHKLIIVFGHVHLVVISVVAWGEYIYIEWSRKWFRRCLTSG